MGLVGFSQLVLLFELPQLVRGVLRSQLFPASYDWLPKERAALAASAASYIVPLASLRPHLPALHTALLQSTTQRVGRAVGAALSVATAILGGCATHRSQLLLLTGGAPSHGPGALLLHDRAAAVAFYRATAADAAKTSTVYVSSNAGNLLCH